MEKLINPTIPVMYVKTITRDVTETKRYGTIYIFNAEGFFSIEEGSFYKVYPFMVIDIYGLLNQPIINFSPYIVGNETPHADELTPLTNNLYATVEKDFIEKVIKPNILKRARELRLVESNSFLLPKWIVKGIAILFGISFLIAIGGSCWLICLKNQDLWE